MFSRVPSTCQRELLKRREGHWWSDVRRTTVVTAWGLERDRYRGIWEEVRVDGRGQVDMGFSNKRRWTVFVLLKPGFFCRL